MSTERTELALVVDKALREVTGIYDTTDSENQLIADAILAAGYRKPRTITTAEELDGLAHGSVIVDRDGDAWQRYTTGWTCADRAMNTVDQPSVNLTNILGPATVLWEPK